MKIDKPLAERLSNCASEIASILDKHIPELRKFYCDKLESAIYISLFGHLSFPRLDLTKEK